MQEITEQFINQIEQDQNFSLNTKNAYKSDLRDLQEYALSTNSKLTDINQGWIKNYLRYLEENNKERNSYNRRASTFRSFLKFLYRNNLLPTNYSLIVNNLSPFSKSQEDFPLQDIKKIIEDTKLKTQQRLILLLIGRLGLNATQITALNTHQVDFESKSITISDTEKIELPYDIFKTLREYLMEVRNNTQGAENQLSLFLNENGSPLTEADIYRLIKKLSEELNLAGKLTTRNLKKSFENKADIFTMQKEIFSVTAPD